MTATPSGRTPPRTQSASPTSSATPGQQPDMPPGRSHHSPFCAFSPPMAADASARVRTSGASTPSRPANAFRLSSYFSLGGSAARLCDCRRSYHRHADSMKID